MVFGLGPPAAGSEDRLAWFHKFVQSKTSSLDRFDQLPSTMQTDLLLKMTDGQGLEGQLAKLLQESVALDAKIAASQEMKLNREKMDRGNQESHLIRGQDGIERKMSEVSTELY